MKKFLKSIACVLSVVMLFSLAGMVSPKLMPLGPDVVSAASEENSTSTSEESTTTTESATTSQATNVLKVGAKGDAVKNLQTMLNNFGYNLEVDGYFGNLTSEAVKDFQSKNGLTADGIVGPKTYEVLEAGIESTDSTTKEEVATNDSALRLGKVDYAAHGNKSFAVVVVALAGDKIQDAYIDEFQFMSTDVATGVPNSDGDFGANYADPTVVLASKRVNTEYYSEHMKEEAGATTPLHKSYDAIQTHVKGMTITQLEEELSVNTSEGMVDVVSGATLRDTAGYLQAILAAAKNASENAPIQVDSTVLSNLELGKVNYAAHGNKSFAVTVAAVSGDQIVGAYIDEYQFMSTDVATGVPNSDGDFGANYADPTVVLASKRANTEYYSEHMKEAAGATTPLHKSYDAIQEYVQGKTIEELESELSIIPSEEMADVVSGATLADTAGYLHSIVAAAKEVGKVEEESRELKVGKVEYAAHGNKCFTIAVAILEGNTIVEAYIDEYQFMSTDVATGVPNSDGDFGANYADSTVVLASKRLNAEYYSEHMKEEAGATTPLNKSYDAIQEYVKGMTVEELESELSVVPSEDMVDAVSGATLRDTAGYLKAILAAAKEAK